MKKTARIAVWKLQPVDRRKRRLTPHFMLSFGLTRTGLIQTRVILEKRDARRLLRELTKALK